MLLWGSWSIAPVGNLPSPSSRSPGMPGWQEGMGRRKPHWMSQSLT